MEILQECKQERTDKIIVVKENKSEFKINNPLQKKILQIKVDGCLDFEGKRCDYFFDVKSERQYFVELKGHQFSTAIKQLINTHKEFKSSGEIDLMDVYFCIVMSSVPKISGLRQSLEKKLRKENIKLIIKNRRLVEDV